MVAVFYNQTLAKRSIGIYDRKEMDGSNGLRGKVGGG